MGIRNCFLQRQAEMDSKINNQTMGGVSRNTSRVLNPPGGRSNMSDILEAEKLGLNRIKNRSKNLPKNRSNFLKIIKLKQKMLKTAKLKQTPVKTAEMMLPNTSNEILSLKFLGNAFLTDYNRTALISVFLLKIFVDAIK